MHDHDPAVVSGSRSLWTEDRVERLLLSLFADTPSMVTTPTANNRRHHHGARQMLLVAVAAACLAVIVPALSTRVEESSGNQSPLARWVGPTAAPFVTPMNLAATEEPEAMNDDEASATSDEADETAEAPGATETEESAST